MNFLVLIAPTVPFIYSLKIVETGYNLSLEFTGKAPYLHFSENTMDVPGSKNALKSVTGDGSDAKFLIDLKAQIHTVLLSPDTFTSVRMAV